MAKKENKNLLIAGSFFILLGILFISFDFVKTKKEIIEDQSLIEQFYEETLDEEQTIVTENKDTKTDNIIYIAVLKIPKINLERGILPKDHYLNHVDRNIELIKESDMPDKDKGNFIVASHSGNAKVSYFRNLNKVKEGDYVYVYYKSKEYKYKITNIYLIDKSGEALIKRNNGKTTITLITCKKKSNKQYVYIGELE